MDKARVSFQLEGMAGDLQSALLNKGPYILEINGVRTDVSREQFLAFYIDVAIEELWGLKELVDDELSITDLPDGGCIVTFEGETTHYSKEEVEDMKKDYLLAKHKIHIKGDPYV